MSKLTYVLFAAIFSLLFAGMLRTDRFSKYKQIESYEIRPSVLVTPRYSSNGQICEIAIEKTHYALGVVNLEPALPRKDFVQIIDELIPVNERGHLTSELFQDYLSIHSGTSVTSSKDYENVSINIYGTTTPSRGVKDVMAIVSWKRSGCAQTP